MKIYDTCKCFMKSRHKDIPLTLWVFRGNRLGNGYCLKGSEMVRFFFENQARSGNILLETEQQV